MEEFWVISLLYWDFIAWKSDENAEFFVDSLSTPPPRPKKKKKEKVVGDQD